MLTWATGLTAMNAKVVGVCYHGNSMLVSNKQVTMYEHDGGEQNTRLD